MPKISKEDNYKEYSLLLDLFKDVIRDIKNKKKRWATLEDLMMERADLAIRHAFTGFGMSYDEAFELLKNANNLTNEQHTQRDILVAAVDNLVDFAVAEEYQAIEEVEEMEELGDLQEYAEDSDEYDELMAILCNVCKKYNYQYAYTENLDIEYAMSVALYLSYINDNETLMYMTMGDERVRSWHLQYEGFTAPRSQFPSWLIPPIEHQCRCFLIHDTKSISGEIQDIQANGGTDNAPKMPNWFNRTFKESVANGGRIFSDEHPYFNIKKKHLKRLSKIANNIKLKYLPNGKQ